MRGIYIVLIICPLLCNICFGQKMAITLEGDTVMLNNDHTWYEVNLLQLSDSGSNVTIEKDDMDVFEGSRRTTTKSWINFASSDMGFLLGSAVRIDSMYGINIAVARGVDCLKQFESSLRVKLANGEVIELIQLTEDNCSKIPSATFFLVSDQDVDNETFMAEQQGNIEKLTKYRWTSIRIDGNEHHAIFYPSESNKFDATLFFSEHLEALRLLEN